MEWHPQHLPRHLLQQTAAVRLQPLGGPGDPGIRAQEGFDPGQYLAEHMARHHQQQHGGGLHRRLQIRRQLQIGREGDIRQECLVAAILFQLGDMGRVVTPQQGRMTIARQRNGKGGAIRPRPQDRDCDLVGHYQASAVACWACTCAMCWANRASKLTGARFSCGKEPLLTRLDTASRAYGNRMFGQKAARQWASCGSGRLPMVKMPACCTSHRKAVSVSSLQVT